MQCTGESPLEGKLPPKLAKMFFAVEFQPPSSIPTVAALIMHCKVVSGQLTHSLGNELRCLPLKRWSTASVYTWTSIAFVGNQEHRAPVLSALTDTPDTERAGQLAVGKWFRLFSAVSKFTGLQIGCND